MSFKINSNHKQIVFDKKLASSAFLRLFAEEVVKQSEKFTPLKSGQLRSNVTKQVLGLKGKIRWEEPYAQFQERGARADGTRRVRRYTTPGTGKGFALKGVKQALEMTLEIAKKVNL